MMIPVYEEDIGRGTHEHSLRASQSGGKRAVSSQRENAFLTEIWRRIMRLIIEAHLIDDEGSLSEELLLRATDSLARCRLCSAL